MLYNGYDKIYPYLIFNYFRSPTNVPVFQPAVRTSSSSPIDLCIRDLHSFNAFNAPFDTDLYHTQAASIIITDLVGTPHTATAQMSRCRRDVNAVNCARQPTYLMWPDMWKAYASPVLMHVISGVPTWAGI